MSWQGPPDTARNWPGAHPPAGGHPYGTTYNSFGVPQYPPGTTCEMLGEREPHFPVTWHLVLLCFVALLLYVIWPLYVLRHLMRKKSIYGDQEIFETNHEKFKGYGEKFVQRNRDEKVEE